MAKKSVVVEAGKTVGELAVAYQAAMETEGKSFGTVASYSIELRSAQDELGAETKLRDLTPDRVAAYFNCPRVMRLKSGEPKSVLSVAKTRRVLRLALVHALAMGWIDQLPLPAAEVVEAQAS